MTSFYFALTLSLSLPAFADSPTGAALVDSEIVKIVEVINRAEIEAARIAQAKVKSPQVIEFAKMMVSQHRQNLKDLNRVVSTDKLDFKESDTSKSLEDNAKNSNADLKNTKTNFDKAYIEQQTTMHQQALEFLDNTALPQVKNEGLKVFLKKTREAVNTHLEHAKGISSKLQ